MMYNSIVEISSLNFFEFGQHITTKLNLKINAQDRAGGIAYEKS